MEAHHFTARVLQDIPEFRGRQTEVDPHRDCTKAGYRQIERPVFKTIEEQHTNSVATVNLELSERIRVLVTALMQLRIRPRDPVFNRQCRTNCIFDERRLLHKISDDTCVHAMTSSSHDRERIDGGSDPPVTFSGAATKRNS